MVAADGKAVAIAAEHEHVQVVIAEADAGRERQGPAMDVVAAVGVDEVGEARRTTDAGEGDDLLLRILELLQHAVEGGQDGEVAATGAPGGVIGDEDLLGQGRTSRRGRGEGGGHDKGRIKKE